MVIVESVNDSTFLLSAPSPIISTKTFVCMACLVR